MASTFIPSASSFSGSLPKLSIRSAVNVMYVFSVLVAIPSFNFMAFKSCFVILTNITYPSSLPVEPSVRE